MFFDFTGDIQPLIDYAVYIFRYLVRGSVAFFSGILLIALDVYSDQIATAFNVFRITVLSRPVLAFFLRPFVKATTFSFLLPVALVGALYVLLRILIRPFLKEPFDFQVHIPTEPPQKTAHSNEYYGKHRYQQLKNITLHYTIKLPKGNENYEYLMVLLHGFGGFWFSWRNQIDFFSQLPNYGIVSVDLRGCGDSEKPYSISNYKLEYLVEDVKQLLDEINPGKKRKVILVGHSWGGVITYEFVLHYSNYIHKYITICVPPPYALNVTTKQLKNAWFVSFFLLPRLPEIFLESGNLKYFDKLYKCDEEDTIKAYKYAFGKSGSFQYPLNYYRANIIKLLDYVLYGCKLAKNVQTEGLAINTDEDAIIDRTAYKNGYKVPNLTVKQLTGHHYPHEDPYNAYFVNHAIYQFIEPRDKRQSLVGISSVAMPTVASDF